MQSKKGFTPLKVSSSLYFKFLTVDNTNMADETTREVRATLTPLDIFSFKKVTDFRKKSTNLCSSTYLHNVKKLRYKVRNTLKETDAKGKKGRDRFRDNLIIRAPDLCYTS